MLRYLVVTNIYLRILVNNFFISLMVYFTRLLSNFKYALVKNFDYTPLLLTKNKNITNASCIIVWYNPKKDNYHYLIQKRSKYMKNGKGKLAIGGGMLEDYDLTLQYGATREIFEESQVNFKKFNLTMKEKTIKQISKHLFYLSHDKTNYTFYLIISSNKMPQWNGPINKNIHPFKESVKEIDLEDNLWNNKKLANRIKNGHCFMTKDEIRNHYNKLPQIWFYSRISLEKLFTILEN